MKDQLTAYVDLLFAGRPDAEDIKQKILQSTLDRYDELLEQGQTPQSAYTLAISGIGDVAEILSRTEPTDLNPELSQQEIQANRKKANRKKLLRSLAIGLYMFCPLPLFFLQNWTGLGLLLAAAAVATVLLVLGRKGVTSRDEFDNPDLNPQQKKFRRSLRSIINVGALAIYLVVSLSSHAWMITWLIFPIGWSTVGLINAILDLKGAK